MILGAEIKFNYTDKQMSIKGWIYFYNENQIGLVVTNKTKLLNGLVAKNTLFTFDRTLINNIKYI